MTSPVLSPGQSTAPAKLSLFRRWHRAQILRSLGPYLGHDGRRRVDALVATRSEWQAFMAVLPLPVWRRLHSRGAWEDIRRRAIAACGEALLAIQARNGRP